MFIRHLKVILRLLAFVPFVSTASDQWISKYDGADVKRFEEELLRLGVVLPSVTNPDLTVEPPSPTVSSPAGDFEGFWTKSQFGRPIAAFEGIPYAKPPVGTLRFKVAQPIPKLSNFQAKKPGSQCYGRDMFTKKPEVEGNEDCLYINVYVPQNVSWTEAEKLPVIFFVHGGSFVGGCGHLYPPNVFLDKDVVFVTFNYRLGPLGFLSTGDGVIPGNLGLKDQVAALQWVHKNIGAFGGDPNLITVLGHSAGSASAEFLMLTPLTNGLIKRVIALSGSSLALWSCVSPGKMRENVQKAAQHLNCPSESSEQLLDCLQNKTAKEIASVDYHFRRWKKSPVWPFRPVVEGDLPGAILPQHPKNLFTGGLSNDVPFMVGVTSEEGSFFSVDIFLNETLVRELDENFLELGSQSLVLDEPHQKRQDNFDSLRRAYFSPGSLSVSSISQGTKLYTDVYITWPAIKSNYYHKQNARSPRYFSFLSFEGSRTFVQYPPGYSSKGGGVSHGDELFYIFNFPSKTAPNPDDILMSMIFTDLYTSFARDGVPSSNLIPTQWLPVTTTGTDIEYLHIKSPIDISMKRDLLPERWHLLHKLFEPAQNTTAT